jgi:glycosyltransferase involved in cell wall biosynthesis
VRKIKYIYKNPNELKNMGENSRKYFIGHFTRKQMTKKYYEILENIEL